MRSGALWMVVALTACGGGGGEPDHRPAVADERAASGRPGVVPRAERLARTAAELDSHRRETDSMALAEPLAAACAALLAGAPEGPYVETRPFATSVRDARFVAAWDSAQPAVHPRQLEAVASLADQLRARGIELLVVPIPRPPQIYPERLVEGLAVPPGFVGTDPGLAAFLAALVDRGVEVLHLTPAFAAARERAVPDANRFLFHDVNHHWTPRAVELTADLVAARVRQMEGFEPGPLREGRDWRPVRETVDYRLPMYGRGKVSVPVALGRIVDDAGEGAFASTATSPVLILGDSNSAWYREEDAGIADHLTARLGQQVDLIAVPGQRPLSAWETVLRRRDPAERLDQKAVVIWIFEAAKLLEDDLAPLELFGG